MSLAAVAEVVAGFAAAAGCAASLWRGAARQPWPDRLPYRWFMLAAGLVFASVAVDQTVSVSPGETSMLLSFADLPALLFLLAMVMGLAGLAATARGATAEAAPVRHSRRGLATACAYLVDGYVLAAALFLIGWAAVFGSAFGRSGDGAATFAGELVHPLADLIVLGAVLPLVQVAGRRAVAPYLALVAMTVGDSLAVSARVTGAHPGTAVLAAQLTCLVLLALTPWVGSAWPAPEGWWIGDSRGAPTVAAAATAIVAALLVAVRVMVSGQLPALAEFFILSAMAAVLAIRVISLVRRVDSWSRVWQESGRQFRQLAERTSDVVLLCDLDGVIRYASRAVAGYGYTPDTLRGTPLAELLHPEDRAGGTRAIRRAVGGKAQRVGRYPCRVRAADGTWRHVQATVSLYRDPGHPDKLLITARDMSAQVALRRRVTQLTFHDALTGLPNRAYLEQRAQEVLGAAEAAGRAGGERPVAGVIVLDIDGFTAINEERGQAAGDLLLAQVARRLRLAVSPKDTVARWAGNEFAVLTESAASAEELADVAERLVRGIASLPFGVGDADLTITASAGFALADGSSPAEVWRGAEIALARAKESGAGRVEMFRAGRTGPGAGAKPKPSSEAGPGPARGLKAGATRGTVGGEVAETPAGAAAGPPPGAA